jgi:hypothetical protein
MCYTSGYILYFLSCATLFYLEDFFFVFFDFLTFLDDVLSALTASSSLARFFVDVALLVFLARLLELLLLLLLVVVVVVVL